MWLWISKMYDSHDIREGREEVEYFVVIRWSGMLLKRGLGLVANIYYKF
jgi:hypothetical protein